jgi:predicted nucleotidyltransferase
MERDLLLEYLGETAEKFSVEYDAVTGLVLFGSYASGKHREDSDVDIRVYMENSFENPTKYFDFRTEMIGFLQGKVGSPIHNPVVDIYDGFSFKQIKKTFKAKSGRHRKRKFMHECCIFIPEEDQRTRFLGRLKRYRKLEQVIVNLAE